MKSVAIASALFASLAVAAPLNKRAYATLTHTVVETVVVYTTVWDGQQATDAAAAPTSSPGLFYEHHKHSSHAVSVTSTAAVPAQSSSTEAVVSSSTQVVVPSSTYEVVIPSSSTTPVVESPTPTPEPSSSPAQVPASSSTPTPSSTTPVESTPTGGSGGGSGTSYAGSLTMNYYGGGKGACGEPIADDTMVAALAVTGFGDSTYDVATGNPTNKWCNQKIRITYNGKTADAKIMDRCSGCTGAGGLDATPALWEALTGGVGGASGDRLESGMSWVAI